MSHRVPITVRLERFEGPLDLLLYLIQSNELDVSTVSLTKITDQYLAYVYAIQELSFDIASEFLVMAATLLHWKSKAILDREEKGEEQEVAVEDFGPTPEELLRQLLEHQRFLAAGDELAQLPRLGEDVFARPNVKPPVERVWRDMDISDLALSLQDAMVHARNRKSILKKETVSVAEKIRQFASTLPVGKVTELAELMGVNPARPEKVVTFLASLELGKLRKLKLYQQITYDPIYVELMENIENLNLLLSDFDQPVKPVDAPEAPAEPAPAEAAPVENAL